MSCSDCKKSKKRKSNKSGNMGDVLGKECGDGEKGEIIQEREASEEDVREEADGAPSGDDQSSQSSGEMDCFEFKEAEEAKGIATDPEGTSVSPTAAANSLMREEKPCMCEACKDRREVATEQLEEMRRLQSYWMELRQDIRQIYRMAMEGSMGDSNRSDDWPNEAKMKELVRKLCVCDPHQLFQRLEAQVQEFVIEAKVRQLELLHREQQTPALAEIFLSGLLEGYEKLCLAAKRLAPLLQQLEVEHLNRRFSLTWEVLNKHLYQSCVYTDPLIQNNLPVFISQLRSLPPTKDQKGNDMVHQYVAFDDEMALIGAMWRDVETLIHEYNQEQATLKAKQRMLREDWELFKAHRKLLQQQMWNKTANELRELDDPLSTLAGLGPGPGSGGEDGFCPGCSSRRCPCDECTMSHMLTCGLITPPESPSETNGGSLGSQFSHKVDMVRDFRYEGEGSEQPPLPASPDTEGGTELVVQEESTELVSAQQSCECHVCTAPLMSPVELMENYECHSCVQQGVSVSGPTATTNNMNLQTGGFHLYPHIHGTGGVGDAGRLYPHLYNIHPSVLSQLGTKHSRLGAHLQDQLQLAANDQKQLLSQLPVAPVNEMMTSLSLDALPNNSASFTASTQSQATPPAQDVLNRSESPQTPPLPSPRNSSPAKTPCKHNGKHPESPPGIAEPAPPNHSKQSTASTQTSPKAHIHVQTAKQPQSLSKSSSPPAPAHVPHSSSEAAVTKSSSTPSSPPPVMNGHVGGHKLPPPSSVRHSTTQTGNPTGHTHSHQSLPDVVRSAASTVPHKAQPSHQSVTSSTAKVPQHACHKGLKNGSIEPIKRVSSTEYPDSEVVDLEDSSSQDDTCSERSSSTTTSTQRDSRHCDCCYCEVFGHGMPSVAPVSRNYQEMRERLRLLLTKKKAKCKSGNASSTPGAADSVASSKDKEADKDGPKPENDTRDLKALLDFIEGSPSSGRCTDAKKAAKKAKQKKKKLEKKMRKEQEEQERQRLEELQTKTPEVTITVVNPPSSGVHVPQPSKTQGSVKNQNVKKESRNNGNPSTPVSSTSDKPPQMVTIKRVMEPNSAEPTVTITLKGETPDKDKVLFTLVNGQVCQAQESADSSSQKQNNNNNSSKNNKNNKNNQNASSNNNTSNNSKKKKKKNNSQAASSTHSTASKAPTSSNSTASSPATVSVNRSPATNISIINRSNVSVTNHSFPVNNGPKLQETATKFNSLIKNLSRSVPLPNSPASATNSNSIAVESKSFSLENLKLPPGITITKVEGPANAPQRKPPAKQEVPKKQQQPNAAATAIIAPSSAPSNKSSGMGLPAGLNGPNVIVVDTGKLRDGPGDMNGKKSEQQHPDDSNQSSNGKKKKKKKNNGQQEVNQTNSGVSSNSNKQKQQTVNQPANQKQQSNVSINGVNNKMQSKSQQQQQTLSKANSRQPSNSVHVSQQNKLNSPSNNKVAQNGKQQQQVNGCAKLDVNGEVAKSKPSKKSGKGKENVVGPRFSISDAEAFRSKALEMNGVVAHVTSNAKVVRVSQENGFVAGAANVVVTARAKLQDSGSKKNQQVVAHNGSCVQPRSSVREFVAAMTGSDANSQEALKRKKKKKKGQANQPGMEDCLSVDSVFAPKDIDLENGDIDDDERELEAFKRFCFNSVPLERKEKVHLNIKDIVLKKKSAVDCS